ncbi:hypothetical protein [Neisseria subflava]|nr:hypothetical protein [Neisseria subflava]
MVTSMPMRLATLLHTCSFIVNSSLTVGTTALGIWLGITAKSA